MRGEGQDQRFALNDEKLAAKRTARDIPGGATHADVNVMKSGACFHLHTFRSASCRDLFMA